jgi:FtsP/CotA-like multicopper oxidase with cupredoxin domain
MALLLGPVGAPTAAATPNPLGMVCTEELDDTFDLETATGYIATPDGNSVFMWGYRLVDGSFQLPGPILCVTEGDTVTVNLTNNLSEPASIVFPGQVGVTHDDLTPPLQFTGEADPSGGSVSYSFIAGEPGTYLYESGTNPGKQVQMGLYGALVVRPLMGASYAYNDTATQFDPGREYIIILGEVDPDLHQAVEFGQPYDVTAFHPTYWHVNGRSFPDSIAGNFAAWLPSQPYGALVLVEPYNASTNPDSALIRYLNAGMVNHPFHPHGNHLRVIARDGRLLRGPAGQDTSFENFTRTIGSGQTYDLLFKWTVVDPWIDPGGDPVPVTIPGLQNLVFKDDSTFYSGDPELGETGPLPVGVTTFNECGEFYFPWHSHALFEFTNFDEGFGGLATVLRVDPPGGCP